MDKAAAIVTTQESIQQKLTALDLNILAILKQLRLVEKQKNQDQLAYDNYYATWQEEKSKASCFECLMGKPEFDHNAPEVRNYKGRLILRAESIHPTIYGNDGSEGKYNALRSKLSRNQTISFKYQHDFELGKRHQDLEFLQLIEKDLQDHLNS